MSGVLQQERDRKAAWAAAGLPDPADISTVEHAMESRGFIGWRDPRRAEINAYITENGRAALPGDLPNNWS
jgi:hypothetical protein